MVLCLIVAGNGTNELVEEHRGDLNCSLLEEEDVLPKVPDSLGFKGDNENNDDFSDGGVNFEGGKDEEDDASDVEAEAERLIDGM